MAKNFKKVMHNISYRHLGSDVYHVAFLFEEATIAARRKMWSGELWSLPFVGREWHRVFPPEFVVESCHIVRHKDGGDTAYSGKDEVRAQLLKRAFSARLDKSPTLPGLSLLWRQTVRGTTSQAAIIMRRASTNLEQEPSSTTMYAEWSSRGTRCPECGQTQCGEDCTSLS